jgi:uncharacterized protein (DUF488 family)
MEYFLQLLRAHAIDVVIDTRSFPYSKYAPQFNVDVLRNVIKASKLRFGYLGRELGGRPAEDEFYDEAGHALYYKVAEWPPFREGIARVMEGIRDFRVALLCSEENPSGCHRRLLVSRVLGESGVNVLHIRGDGRVQTEEELKREEAAAKGESAQPLLFTPPVPAREEWKSIQSVLDRRRPRSSSGDYDPLAFGS